MAESDAFALKNSGLNEFLVADVGTEVNGYPLTMLSVLARLGMDPWTEGARLARMPKSAIIDSLETNISQMPLCPQALRDARITAARLFLLLPSQVLSPRHLDAVRIGKTSFPAWVPLAAFVAALGLALAFEMMPRPSSTIAFTPTADQQAAPPQKPAN